MEHFGSNHHDFIDETDIVKLREKNAVTREVLFLQKLEDLRQDTISILEKHQALNRSGGWAMFIEDIYNGESGYGEPPNRREILVALEADEKARNGENYVPPTVRIVTNECFMREGSVQWLCEDFIVGRDGKPIYYIDAVDLRNDEVQEQFATIFTIDQSNRVFLHGQFAHGPHVLRVNGAQKDEEPTPIYPFGDPRSVGDGLEAIEMGMMLLDEVRDLTPRHIS